MSFDDYLKDIGKVPLLTTEEEIVLGNSVQAMIRLLESKGLSQQISATNIDSIIILLESDEQKVVKRGIKARNKMVAANMRLVVAIAKKYLNKHVHMTMQDLIQEGAIGLTRAAEKFDPSRGYKFSTYAYLWIKQGMTRGCESQEGAIKLPAHMQRTIRKASEVRSRLAVKLRREPSFQEISDEMGEQDSEKIRAIIMSSPVVISLDIKAEDSQNGYSSYLIDFINTEDEAEIKDREDIAAKLDFLMMAIQALSEDDRELILQKYGVGTDQLSVKEIARNQGVAPQEIRERQQKIARKIKYVVTRFAMPSA